MESHLNWWFSCKWATAYIQTDGRGIITDAAPIFRKFIGQSMYRLIAITNGEARPLRDIERQSTIGLTEGRNIQEMV